MARMEQEAKLAFPDFGLAPSYVHSLERQWDTSSGFEDTELGLPHLRDRSGQRGVQAKSRTSAKALSVVEDWERPGWLELREGGEMGQQGRGWVGKASWAVARNWWGVCVLFFKGPSGY